MKFFVLTIGLFFLGSLTFSAGPEEKESITTDQQNPQVEMKTSKGTMVIELYPDKAPLTVKNFLTYVEEGFFDGTIFHRVMRDFMIQGGGFDTEGKEKPTHEPIKNEADNGLSNKRGTISMARTNDPDSATSQFFINHVNNVGLDFTSKASGRSWGYCVFGKVIEGMKVVDDIAMVKTGSHGPHQNWPVENVIIQKVTLIKKTTEK